MKDFEYMKAADVGAARQLIGKGGCRKFLGGGTNLVDLMREEIETPEVVVDVTALPLSGIEERADGSIAIGATVKNTAVAAHPQIRARWPVLAQAILAGASGQIRNMATVGGNLMQRTRCPYFYDKASRCNKRTPGSGCDALEGFNRNHAILGVSESCIATHPSDMCVALAALDAVVVVEGAAGTREIAMGDFHRLPGKTPEVETELKAEELITWVRIPKMPFESRWVYRKVRDRASYAFALVSVAAALHVEAGKIEGVRLALGGVAHKPWRALAAEGALAGKPARVDQFERAADAELAAARGYGHNDFKIELARRMIVGVLRELSETGGM